MVTMGSLHRAGRRPARASTRSRPKPTGPRSAAERRPARCGWPPARSLRPGGRGQRARDLPLGRFRAVPRRDLCGQGRRDPGGSRGSHAAGGHRPRHRRNGVHSIPSLHGARARIGGQRGVQERRGPRRSSRASFGLPEEGLRRAVAHRFGRKKESVREANTKASRPASRSRRSLPEDPAVRRSEYVPGEPLLLMSGNEASAVGAIHAGVPFLRRLSHHAVDRDPAVSSPSGCPARAARSSRRKTSSAIGAVIGASFAGRQVDDGHVGPGAVAHDRDARPLLDGRSPHRHRGRSARRALDRKPDQGRTVRPLPVPLRHRTETRPRRPRLLRRRGMLPRDRSTPSTSPRNSSCRS